MVKRIVSLIIAAGMATGTQAEVSWDDFNRSIGEGEEAIDYSGTLVPHDKLHELIPEDNSTATETGGSGSDRESSKIYQAPASNPSAEEAKATEEAKAQAEAERAAQREEARVAARKQAEAKKKAEAAAANEGRKVLGQSDQNGSTYVYVAPSLSKKSTSSQRNSVLFHAPEKSTVKFGIPIGTKIKVSMSTSASNVLDDVVLTVEETVHGHIQDLTRGSKLFASTDAVMGSERLYLRVTKGLVPGELAHFSLRGVIYAEDGDPGLLANVISDGKTIQRAFVESSATLAEGLIDVVGGGTVAGEAGKVGAKSVLSEKEREEDNRNGRPAYIVQAAPQKGFIFVEDTF